MIGKCTLEKGKSRIPISHPAFEEFRALQYINNIQWRETGSNKTFEPIPLNLKKNILSQLFFKPIEKGERKGKINDRSYFEFKEIVNNFSESHKYEFNFAKYKNEKFDLRTNPNVTTCPLIAGLMNAFNVEWTNKFITKNDFFGINWDGLQLNYKIKYGTCKQKGNNFIPKQIGEERILDKNGIWHLLFDYILTNDNEEGLNAFCKNVLGWDENKTDDFINIGISQGYGSLSYSAIRKITPFLQEGYLYSEAVLFANLKAVLGKEIFDVKEDEVKKEITKTIKDIDKQKELLNITNGLIQQFYSENNTHKAKGVDNIIKDLAYNDTTKKLYSYFGKENWESKTECERKYYIETVFEKYLCFLDGKQRKEEMASSRQNKKPEIDYYKLPRLDESIKQVLRNNYRATEDGLKKLYHPSDIDIYPKSQTGELEDPNPPSKGWKNPMAMRTMFELCNLVNYLLEEGKIDEDTKIIVEMARELNDANKRWAIQTYQKNREDENIEFAKAILGVAKVKYPDLNENDADNIDKIRLWWEQLENGEEIYKQIKTLKEDVQKYRLWKEQECQCMYTGKMIGIVDLFDGTKLQFEHTLHLSKSFDNSLSNQTLCDADYNMRIKKNQIPTQLKNYSEEWNGYPAIEPKLKKWKETVNALIDRIEKNKIETKKAIRIGDLERKNYLIRTRHLLQFDLDYWEKKLKTFTVKEIPNWWKNSQLVDTQIICKYARAYLKSVFNKVDVQKGTITAEFRKIYGIMGDEKKDRSKHSHHAVDAAVLTLIPGSARRDAILEEYYKAKEKQLKYHNVPYENFSIAHIQNIENNILINQVTKDQTLSETVKKVRKGGKIVYLKNTETKQFILDEYGKKIPLIMQGDSIRGQLHKESFLGAIKVNERNENGYPIKKDGKYIVKQEKGEDEIWIVMRKQIDSINFEKDVIIDILLKEHLITQLNNGKNTNELVDFNNNAIRHLRCRVKAGRGFLKSETAIRLKDHTFKSKYEHKQEYRVQNDENYLYLLYEKESYEIEESKTRINECTLDEERAEDIKLIRGYKILNLFDIAKLGLKKIDDLKMEKEYQTIQKKKGKTEHTLKLKAILKVGDRIILFEKHREEITFKNIKDRLFNIYKFNEVTPTGYLYCQYHLEASKDGDLGDGDTKFNPNKYQGRLKLSADNFNCLIENKDFQIRPNGEIILLENIKN